MYVLYCRNLPVRGWGIPSPRASHNPLQELYTWGFTEASVGLGLSAMFWDFAINSNVPGNWGETWGFQSLWCGQVL